MSFLIAAAVLTGVAVLSIAAPLLRRIEPATDSASHDRDFYRARLVEIDNDVTLGKLAKAEAVASRAEEGRKLLAAARQQENAPAAPGKSGRAAILLAALAAPLVAVGFYLLAGQPQMQDMALASRPDRDLSRQSIEQLLERAEARLAGDPGDLRGWTVVAPVYLRLGRVPEAINAYRNAVRLAPGDAAMMAALGEAIVVGESGVVTAEAQSWFEQALAASPGAAKPRFYLAVAMGQQGEWQQAAEAWRTLIAEAPAETPWLAAARQQLAAAQSNLGGGREPLPGPTREDMQAAEQMTLDERQTMIEGMVAGLAEKLAENPIDKPGWRRLIRSYVVLGRGDDAIAAIADARRHFAADPAFLAELESMAAPTLDDR